MRPDRRTALIVTGALLLVLAAGAGGFALGASDSPGAGEAAARAPVVGSGVVGHAEALDSALERGHRFGERDGGAAGERAGARKGTTDAAAIVRKQLRAGLFASVGRSESEAEIGGIDEIAGVEEPGGPLPGSGEVLVVGDSLEVLSSPYLQKYLPDVDLKINAVGGYNSIQIFGLVQESYDPSQSVIVFDAGTNDNPNYPEILAAELQDVAGLIGDRCMVVPTIHGLPVDGTDSSGKNRVVQSFVASRPGTQMPDWAGAVAAHPELMQSDNLHPIAEGADLRAKIIAEGISTCLSYG